MSKAASRSEYSYGPAVSVPIDLPDHFKPIDIDLSKLGENLRRDFPELAQEDWDDLLVHITHELPVTVPQGEVHGITMRDVRSEASISVRAILKLACRKSHSIRFALDKFDTITDSQKELVIAGFGSQAGATIYNPAYVLGHELKHAADHLIEEKNNNRSVAKRMRKRSRDELIESCGNVTGTALGFSGAIESAMGYTGLGISSIAGAVALYFVTDVFNNKNIEFAAASAEHIINDEQCAFAYSIATADSWSGVISSAPENNWFVDGEPWQQ